MKIYPERQIDRQKFPLLRPPPAAAVHPRKRQGAADRLRALPCRAGRRPVHGHAELHGLLARQGLSQGPPARGRPAADLGDPRPDRRIVGTGVHQAYPLVDYGEAGETGFEFMAAASSFFCRLSAGACVAASESGNEPNIDPSALPYPKPVAPPASGAASDSAAPVLSRPYPGMKQPSGTAQAAEAAPEYKR